MTDENDIGIFRQELVSMIPVLLADINENSIILDTCAAPGSKTLQILEKMWKCNINDSVLWANDFDFKRAKMLIHLLQNHNTKNLIVTNCDASIIPMNKNLQPDIIICDVPCSGDGTVRKNKQIKKSWDLRHSYAKHETQVSILENSVNICKVGGTIIYSTCAINPIENEAVIASVLEKYKNTLEIVDVSDKLNKMGIKYHEGLVKWKVYLDSKQLVSCCNFNEINEVKEEMKKENKNLFFKTNIKETMFHNVYTDKNVKSSVLTVSILIIKARSFATKKMCKIIRT